MKVALTQSRSFRAQHMQPPSQAAAQAAVSGITRPSVDWRGRGLRRRREAEAGAGRIHEPLHVLVPRLLRPTRPLRPALAAPVPRASAAS